MNEHPVILFDGVCNFCNYWVNFAIKRDKKKKLMFTLLQGEAAKHLPPQYYFNIASFSSVISMIKPAFRQANDVS
jgi:predicted DCC family thiol-disulfide oxidoreductase YuxK